MDDADRRDLILDMWTAGLAAVDPDRVLAAHLPAFSDRPLTLFALGKAAAGMATAALRHHPIASGLVIAPHGTARPDLLPQTVAFLTAPHPVPDADSVAAGKAAMNFVSALGPSDHLIALISGGGSALMAAPIDGMSLAEKQAITRRLLAEGAPIRDINLVRAACSQVKRGGLWSLCGTDRVSLFVMSDVPGDDGRLVSSGPFSPDVFCQEDLRAAATRYGIPNVADRSGIASRRIPAATIIASSKIFLNAATAAARIRGVTVVDLGDDLEDDAARMAHDHVRLAMGAHTAGTMLWLSGGEASVKISNPDGLGGRNQAYALAAAIAIDGVEGITIFAADSDGIDGNSGAAGAIVDGKTATAIRAAGMHPALMLATNQSHDALAAAQALLTTGPTGVNVNDIRIVLKNAG